MLRPSNAIGNFKSNGSLPSSGPMVVYSCKMSAEKTIIVMIITCDK